MQQQQQPLDGNCHPQAACYPGSACPSAAQHQQPQCHLPQYQQPAPRVNEDRLEDINERMFHRNLPSAPLQAQFDARPVATKYALMPIVDRRPIPTVPVVQRPTYNQTQVFNPGTSHGPWSGFATNVNDESKLRNQFFALQRNNDQAVYVPPFNSDLYVNQVVTSTNSPHFSAVQPFPELFAKPHLAAFDPNPASDRIGINMFDNCTRQQLKGDHRLMTPSKLPDQVLKRHEIK